ncbi:MAG: sulfotransferase [Cyanobacteria bacterium J06638_7]
MSAAESGDVAAQLPRVVAVGFNKCGTRSLAQLFARAGHPVVHQKVAAGWISRFWTTRKIGRLMRLNVEADRAVFFGVDHYVFYGDLIDSSTQGSFDGNTLFRRILADYPDTILVLNWRDPDDWIRSRLSHGHGEFAAREMRLHGLANLDELAQFWRHQWDQHLAAVRAHMASRPEQLIDFQLDHDPIEDLVRRLPRYGLSPEHFSDIGRSRGRQRALAGLRRWWSHHRPRSAW